MKEGGQGIESQASWAFELATAREPESGELSELLDVYHAGSKAFASAPENTDAFLSAGESPRDESLSSAEHAAWTLLASMLLNLDEVLTRN